jgi:hypothetical protein
VRRPTTERRSMSEEERLVEVPEFYRKLGEKRGVAYHFDGNPETWL